MTAQPSKRPSSRRSTTNRDARGSAEDRRRRRQWLVKTFAADVTTNRVTYRIITIDRVVTDRILADEMVQYLRSRPKKYEILSVETVLLCRCYRCGRLLTEDEVSPDRIKPGCEGGKYTRDNIRPACSPCQMKTGSALGHERKAAKRAAKTRTKRMDPS